MVCFALTSADRSIFPRMSHTPCLGYDHLTVQELGSSSYDQHVPSNDCSLCYLTQLNILSSSLTNSLLSLLPKVYPATALRDLFSALYGCSLVRVRTVLTLLKESRDCHEFMCVPPISYFHKMSPYSTNKK